MCWNVQKMLFSHSSSKTYQCPDNSTDAQQWSAVGWSYLSPLQAPQA